MSRVSSPSAEAAVSLLTNRIFTGWFSMMARTSPPRLGPDNSPSPRNNPKLGSGPGGANAPGDSEHRARSAVVSGPAQPLDDFSRATRRGQDRFFPVSRLREDLGKMLQDGKIPASGHHSGTVPGNRLAPGGGLPRVPSLADGSDSSATLVTSLRQGNPWGHQNGHPPGRLAPPFARSRDSRWRSPIRQFVNASAKPLKIRGVVQSRFHTFPGLLQPDPASARAKHPPLKSWIQWRGTHADPDSPAKNTPRALRTDSIGVDPSMMRKP